MKKIRIVAIFMALLLAFSATLASCGGSKDDTTETKDTSSELESESNGDKETDDLIDEEVVTSISGVMNKNWTLAKPNAILPATPVAYKGTFSAPQNGFIVSTENAQDNSKRVTYVYNVSTDKELVKLEDSYKEETTGTGYSSITVYNYVSNYVDIISADYFTVLTVTRASSRSTRAAYTSSNFGAAMYAFSESNAAYFAKYTLTVYKADGTAVKTFTDAEIAEKCNNSITSFDRTTSGAYYEMIKDYQPKANNNNDGEIFCDLTVKENKVYRKGNDGALVLVKDYGVSKMPDFKSLRQMGDKYYEPFDTSIIVYGNDLTEEYTYTYPGHAANVTYSLLANGSLLIQYGIELDDGAVDFDYRTSGKDGKKYELVTMLVNKDGSAKLDEIDFKLIAIKPSLAGADGQKIYADNVENLAIVVPIVKNQPIDTAQSNWQLMIISNDCKKISRVVVEGERIVDFPAPLNDDCFFVNVYGGGKVVYNENGDKLGKLESFDPSALLGGKYICVENDAIYDLKGTKIYDLNANKANYVVLGDSLIIISDLDGKIKYSTFIGGEVKELAGQVIQASTKGYFAEKKLKEGKTDVYDYYYYNVNGEHIGVFEHALEIEFEGDGFLLMRENVTGGSTYKFNFAK